MAQVDAIKAVISADDREFQSALKRSESGLKNFAGELGRTTVQLAKIGAAAAAAGAAIVTGIVRSSMQAIDAQSKLARQVGGTVGAIQTLERAGELAGVSSSALAASLGTLNQRLGEAQQGTGTAAAALRRLGLDAAELSRMDADARLRTLAEAMRDLPAERVAFELRELGIRSREMAVLLGDGGDALRQAEIEARAFGLAVSDVDAQAIERANDAFSSGRALLTGMGRTLTLELVGPIEQAAIRMRDAAIETDGFRVQIKRAVDIAVQGLGHVANTADIIMRAFRVTADAIIALGASFSRMAALLSLDMDKVRISAEVARLSIEAIKEELDRPLAGNRVVDWINEAREAAEIARLEFEDSPIMGGITDEMAEEAQEQVREHLEEIELINLRHYERMGEMAQRELDRANERRERARENDIKSMRSNFGRALSMFGEHSKGMFRLSKAYAISDAIVSAYQGISRTMAAYPYPLSAAMASAQAAMAFAQVRSIQAQQFGSSGGGGVAGGGGGVAGGGVGGAAPMQRQEMVVRGLSQSEFVRGTDVQAIAEQLLEFQRDGGRVVFA